jgi:DNA-binding transcriptional LysR family regulator
VLAEPVIVLPQSVTSRQALEAAVAAAGASYSSLLEAANGTIAQALAAAGRGIAVVSDDQQFGLVPVAVDTGEGILSVQLIAVWDERHPAAATVEVFARRLGQFSRERYGALPT